MKDGRISQAEIIDKAMNKWLQDFAYRIKIDWTFFVIAGVLALLIAIFTVSFRAIKAAVANPVKSLKTE